MNFSKSFTDIMVGKLIMMLLIIVFMFLTTTDVKHVDKHVCFYCGKEISEYVDYVTDRSGNRWHAECYLTQLKEEKDDN